MAKDYYSVLEVTRSASQEDISKSFKKLARKYHPDVNPGDKKAEDKFKEISEAYQVLSDPKKRKNYDNFGQADFSGFPGGGPGGAGGFGGGGGTPFDFEDIFGDLFAGAGVGGRGRRRSGGFEYNTGRPMARAGADLNYQMDLPFLEAVLGIEKTIRLSNGVSFKVKIPAGVKEGSRIRLAGKGEPGISGGPAGDLYIETHVLPHPYFRRVENDIELDLPITISEAVGGGKIAIPTLDGEVQLKIPAGAQTGQKMRLKGKGVPSAKGTAGDQYVVLQVQAPKHLDSETTQKLLDLLKDKENNPRKFPT